MKMQHFWILQAEMAVIAVLMAAIAMKTCSDKSIQSLQQVFIDDKGRVVYPYLQREVKNTIIANAREIQQCFNQFVEKKPSAPDTGEIQTDWMIGADGSASKVRVVFSSYRDVDFEACIVRTLSGWRFPSPGQSTYAEHRFTFAKQQAAGK